MELDDVIPHPRYVMHQTRDIRAEPAAVWDALLRVTMSALPLSYALEGLRLLPARLAGKPYRPLADRTFLDVTPIPVLHSEPPRLLIAAGLTQAWRLFGGPPLPYLDGPALRAWSRPGWIKVGMAYRLTPRPHGTRLTIETRSLATDRAAQRAFAAYWFVIRPSSALIRREVLRAVAQRTERGGAR